MTETERTVMLWPVELKQRVQALVGPRGLTAFTIEAVQDKLARQEAPARQEAQVRTGEPGELPRITPPPGPTHSADITAKIMAGSRAERTEELKQRFGLSAASELPKPEPKQAVEEVQAEPLQAEPEEPSADPPGATSSSTCPNCYAPLIDGTCWACAL